MAILVPLVAAVPQRLALADGSFSVQWQQERLTVVAEGVSLARVLREVVRQTDLQVRDMAGIQREVRIHFSGLSLRPAVTRLLAGTNYALIDGPAGLRGQRKLMVLIVGDSSNAIAQRHRSLGNPTVTAVKQVSAEDAIKEAGRLREAAQSGDGGALRHAATDGDPVAQAVALQLLASSDPEQAGKLAAIAARSPDLNRRLGGLQVLAGVDTPDAQNALGAALKDPELVVRQAAVIGLLGQTDPGTVQLLVQATADPDQSIRMQALEFLSQRGAEGASGLTSALGSSDPQVRSRAQELLGQMK
jgi:hypothetical protein